MEPMTYGQMVAAHLDELRREAARENRARRAQRSVAAWRIYSGRMLVSAGEWLQGCCEAAVGAEPKTQIRVIG
jgi:hypothetical protein